MPSSSTRTTEELGQAVAPRTRPRMLEAVPLRVETRVAETVCAGEVDDDVGVRRLERGGLLVPEADEDDVRARGEGLAVRDERRQVAVQTRVQRRRSPAGERVGSERDRLEVWMRQEPVEGLLTRISGATEDG